MHLVRGYNGIYPLSFIRSANMSAFEPGRPPRNYRPAIIFLYLIIIIGLLGGAYYAVPRFEWERPQITFTSDSDVLGLAPLVIVVSDQGTGLKSVTATLS